MSSPSEIRKPKQPLEFAQISLGPRFSVGRGMERGHPTGCGIVLGSGRLGGFFLQRKMHAFMAAVLLGMAGCPPTSAGLKSIACWGKDRANDSRLLQQEIAKASPSCSP